MKISRSLIVIACAGLLVGCAASIPPTELVNARLAYQHASANLAAELTPAELSNAREALADPEGSFLDDSASTRTRDLADAAERKASLADVPARSAARKAAATMVNSDSLARLDAMKTRELIAGARRRAAAILEQNSLPQSKQAGSATTRRGQTLKQPKPTSGQRPVPESSGVAFAQNRQRLGLHTDSPGNMRVARILLVDDGRNRSDSVRRILKSPDYQVVVAADCTRAIDLLENNMFDLILLGFALPSESGTRILESLKQYQLTTRVIVIQDASGLDDAVKTATLAARGYVALP